MPTLLRITLDQQDFIIQVLTDRPSHQGRLEIRHGQELYFFKQQGHKWVAETLPEDDGLRKELEAIERALTLRFRVNSALKV